MTEDGRQIGAYRIERMLGEGGMGVVYVGVDTRLGRRAAIKQLLPEFVGDRDLVQRFFNEARAAASINHPGIIEIYDVGWHTDGSAYFAMKLLEGDSLAQRLLSGPLPIPVACTIARQIASALAAAHAAGIVHRDLKPDNVILVRDEEVAIGERATVLDFGIAKLTGGAVVSRRTQTGRMMGTPSYMSPEQCRGAGDVDHRADVYAIGCILFEMLAGTPPFVGVGGGEVLGMHQFVIPRSVRQHRTEVPPGVEAIIMRCLEKQPGQRFQQMAELVSALQRFISRVAPEFSATSSPSVPTATADVPAARKALQSTLAARGEVVAPATLRFAKRRALALFGVAAVVAVVVVAAGARMLRPGSLATSAAAHDAPQDAMLVVERTTGAAPGAANAAVAEPAAAVKPDEAKAKAATCAQFEVAKDWQGLRDCSSELANLGTKDKPTRDKAEEFRVKGVKETGAKAAASRLQNALRDGDLREAQNQLKAIGPDSVYWTAAYDAFAAAEARAIDEDSRKAQALAQAHDCAAVRRLEVQASATRTLGVAGAVAAIAARCVDKVAVAAPDPRPNRGSPLPSNAAPVPSDSPFLPMETHDLSQPSNAAPAPSGDQAPAAARSFCETLNIDDAMTQAQNQFNAGMATAALSLVTKVLACKQDVRMYRIAATFACAAHDAAAAKQFFRKLPAQFQAAIVQRCQQEGLAVP